jgi:hypothetical protein
MEWPGAIWVATDIAGGGVPGLGDLGGALGDLGDLLGGLGMGETVETLREFVVAHEVAHQWWHAVVGNDSMAFPVVDEPLAQFGACLYWEREHGAAAAGQVCPLHIQTQYQLMRSLGNADTRADQPADGFASSLQYGGIVYGKAPGFYAAARAAVGEEALLAGLRSLARERAFAVVEPVDVLAALQRAAPAHARELATLWTHWMSEAHGDEDIGATAPGLEGLGGGGGAGLDELERLLEQLLSPPTTTSTTSTPG